MQQTYINYVKFDETKYSNQILSKSLDLVSCSSGTWNHKTRHLVDLLHPYIYPQFYT